MISIRDEEFIKYTSEVIYQKLLQGVRKNELLYTYGMRGMGKSTALVRLAKELDCPIIVEHYSQVLIYKSAFNYTKIYHQGDSALRGMRFDAVCDEGVDSRKFKDTGINVITGFTNRG